jgi:hypothetical protein
MILVIYLPVMISALLQPGLGVKVEGINYFFDTLLFTGAVLALASAAPGAGAVERASAEVGGRAAPMSR